MKGGDRQGQEEGSLRRRRDGQRWEASMSMLPLYRVRHLTGLCREVSLLLLPSAPMSFFFLTFVFLLKFSVLMLLPRDG